MEQSLNLTLSQHLAMTPEMQQAIQLLQLSAQDLRAVIEKEYMENPTLEMDEPQASDASVREDETEQEPIDFAALSDYLGGGEIRSNRSSDDEEQSPREIAAPAGLSLEQVLLEQADFAFSDRREKAAAVFLIGGIDERGYLTISLKDDSLQRVTGMTASELEHILGIIQGFDPAGVGARDLAECLRLQAERQGIYSGLVARLIDGYLEQLASLDCRELAKKEHSTPEEVQAAADLVRGLNPKPGSSYGLEETRYVVPDVFVREVNGKYQVLLNESSTPHLHISRIYAQADSYDAETRKYLTKHLKSAFWLIKNIEQRKQTIRRVVEEIVRRQKTFLEKGRKFLKPMSMQEIADAIGVHESTVSRAVANKYVQLPHEVLPLRCLFSASLGGASGGGDYASTQVKAVLKELIEGEDKKKPLSDQKLCDLLKERKMPISRRTVMKYREQLGYPSSSKRKRY